MNLWQILVAIKDWLANNWVSAGVALWLIEQGMRAISKLTPWRWDDNLVDVLASALQKIFPKKEGTSG